MERNERGSQIGEKTLYHKLSSLDNEEVSDIERLRKKLNVIEVKIDDIYNHLLVTKTIDPRKSLVGKLNIVSVALLAVGLVVLVVGYIGSDSLMTIASAAISLAGLIALIVSMRIQLSDKPM